MINKTLNQIKESSRQKLILDLVETIIVYKLPQISRQEFLKMMGLNDISLKDTRFYQDVFAEGRQEEALALVLRLINRRFGNISINLELKIKQLELEKIENLAESMLDFNTIEDLEIWLNQQSTVK